MCAFLLLPGLLPEKPVGTWWWAAPRGALVGWLQGRVVAVFEGVQRLFHNVTLLVFSWLSMASVMKTSVRMLKISTW